MKAWPWPLSALLSWALAWAVFAALRSADASASVALLVGVLAGGLPALISPWPLTGWRRALMAGGFPRSMALSGTAAAELPIWAWLLPLALLVAVYPIKAWRDAPFFSDAAWRP